MRHSYRTSLVLAIILIIAPRTDARDEAIAERIDRLFAPAIEGEWLAGAAVGVVHEGRSITLAYGLGAAGPPSRAGGAPPDEDTVYEIGSVSKTFTGTLLADMASRGVVSLDDPVAALLPEGTRVPSRGGRRILLWHLSTHTSGLPRMPDNFAPKDPEDPYADYSAERMYAFLAKARLAHAPGETYDYSNLGAGLLGHALARKAGRPYEELLVERICGPLGMASTRIALTEGMRARLAPPFLADGQPAKNWDLSTLVGAGGIRSTVRDMLAFVRANLRPGDDDLGRAMRLAQEPRHDIPGGRIGLGWHITGERLVWHNGQTGGYHSYVAFDPERGDGVVVLANTATGLVDALGAGVLDLLASRKPTPIRLPVVARVPEETLERYVGTYALAPGAVLTVTRQGDRLYAQLTGQGTFRLFPASGTEFAYRVVDARITFVADGEGKVKELVLHQDGRDLRAPRRE